MATWSGRFAQHGLLLAAYASSDGRLRSFRLVVCAMGVKPNTVSPKLNARGSEKLIPTIQDVLKGYDGKFGPQFLLAALLLDLGASDGISTMVELARANVQPYRLNLIHEKLSMNYTMRRFKDSARTELENAITDVGVLLGESPQSKGHRITGMRRAADIQDL